MLIFLLYAITAVLAGLLGFCVAATQGCLYVGREISKTKSKTGFQDAISPPLLEKGLTGIVVLIVALVIYAFWNFGVSIGFIVVLESLVVIGIGIQLAPKATSPFWVKMIYRSLARRVADYARDNDQLRSDAALSLVKMIEAQYADKLLE